MYLFIETTDWNYINSALVKMYSTEDLQSMGIKFLQMLEILIPYKLAHFIIFDREGNPDMTTSSFAGCNEDDFNEYIRQYFKDDYAQILFNYNRTNCYIDNLLLDKDKLNKTSLMTGYMKPREITNGCGIVFCDGKIKLGMLNIMRTDVQGQISPKEFDVLNVFSEHLHNILLDKQKTYGSYKSIETLEYNSVMSIAKKYDLSNREKEILGLIIQNYSNVEISDLLSISVSTVKTHIFNVFNKLGVKSRMEVLKLVMKN